MDPNKVAHPNFIANPNCARPGNWEAFGISGRVVSEGNFFMRKVNYGMRRAWQVI